MDAADLSGYRVFGQPHPPKMGGASYSSSLYFYNNPEYNQVDYIRIILRKGVKWYIIPNNLI